MVGSGGGVSRRRILLLPVVVGLSGCTAVVTATDPYIQAIKKDPMFSWMPSVPGVVQKISYRPRAADPMRVSVSFVDRALTPPDSVDVSRIVDEAQTAITAAGYSVDQQTRYGGYEDGEDFWISCSVAAARSWSWGESSKTPSYGDRPMDTVLVSFIAPVSRH